MLKTELVGRVSEEAGLSQRQANECLASFVEQITNALARGEKVRLLDFGTFSIKHKAQRQGRNPSTGEQITVRAHNTPHFRPSSALKTALTRGQVNA